MFKEQNSGRTQNIYVAREEEHILDKAREHVPRLEVHERADEVKAVGGSKRDDNVTERRIALDQSVKRDQPR